MSWSRLSLGKDTVTRIMLRSCRPVRPATRRVATKPGFTLVEILIVVVILGILASVVVGKFIGVFASSRDSSIQMNLFRIRSQIGVYREQHNAYPTLANFVNQLTMATDISGNTAAPGTPGFFFGPYLSRMPTNPNTSANAVGNGAVGTSDWFYDDTTGDFHANDSAATFAY